MLNHLERPDEHVIRSLLLGIVHLPNNTLERGANIDANVFVRAVAYFEFMVVIKEGSKKAGSEKKCRHSKCCQIGLGLELFLRIWFKCYLPSSISLTCGFHVRDTTLLSKRRPQRWQRRQTSKYRSQ